MQLLQMPNGAVYPGVEGRIGGAIRMSFDCEAGLEAFLDDLSEGATGSIAGLEGISYEVMGDAVFFSGTLSGDLLRDGEDDEGVRVLNPGATGDRQAVVVAWQNQHGLDPAASDHALAAMGADYGEETAIRLGSGRELRCPVYPEPCSYVRLVVPGVVPLEIAYWEEDEWREAPAEVMGAILGAMRGAHTAT